MEVFIGRLVLPLIIYPLELMRFIDGWDLQFGQKRPLGKLVLAHTRPVLALDPSPPPSSAAHRVDIVEENVILGGEVGDREGAGVMGGISAGKQVEGEGEGMRADC